MVSNENGIFMTYLWEFDSQTWIGRWRLVRSVDGGKSFSTVYTSPPMGSNAPCIETDEMNNILLICTNYTDPSLPFIYYRFEAEKDYKEELSCLPTRSDTPRWQTHTGLIRNETLDQIIWITEQHRFEEEATRVARGDRSGG